MNFTSLPGDPSPEVVLGFLAIITGILSGLGIWHLKLYLLFVQKDRAKEQKEKLGYNKPKVPFDHNVKPCDCDQCTWKLTMATVSPDRRDDFRDYRAKRIGSYSLSRALRDVGSKEYKLKRLRAHYVRSLNRKFITKNVRGSRRMHNRKNNKMPFWMTIAHSLDELWFKNIKLHGEPSKLSFEVKGLRMGMKQ